MGIYRILKENNLGTYDYFPPHRTSVCINLIRFRGLSKTSNPPVEPQLKQITLELSVS